MNGARDDYPLLADAAANGNLLCWTEAGQALDELDVLRSVVLAAWAWKRCKNAPHANTADDSRRHYDSIRFAERNLTEKVDAFLALIGGMEP